MPGSLPEMLERIALGSVAVTATSLLEAGSGELTFVQWRALVVIGGVPGIRISPLGDRLGASQSASSRLVARLARRGLITTQPDPADRRATQLWLSDAGHEVHAEVLAARRRHLAPIAVELDADPDLHLLTVARLASAIARGADGP
jgi:DNA-binding MarR family transcriptional regulator